MNRAVALLALLLLPGVAAHGGELDEALLEAGDAVVIRDFRAPQPGPLLVVPHTEGPLPCGALPGAAYRVPLGPDAGVAFASNETELVALFDVPPDERGYAGFGVDTHDASRALLLMEQNAIALHALGAVVKRPGAPTEFRTGALGVPYPIPGTAAHDMSDMGPGEGLLLDHDDSFGAARWCPGADAPGQILVAIERARLPDSLAPGMVVHVVAIFDAHLDGFPARPIDGSTHSLQANLYLARPGEDAAQVRAALDPGADAHDIVPVVLLLLGLGLVSRRSS